MSSITQNSSATAGRSPALEQGSRKKYYLLHRWAGLCLALVGILVFFSGAVATFHDELEQWAHRGHWVAAAQTIEGFNLDEAYRVASQGVPEPYRAQVDVQQRPGLPLTFFFHEHKQTAGGIEEVGEAVYLNPKGLQVLERRRGAREQALAPTPTESLGQFFLDLHIFLLMPQTLGLIATGITGFNLLLLITTGFIVHRPNASKLARKPRDRRTRLWLGDVHTLVGSWTLPYTVVLALTGAFFSFAGPVLIPVVAMVAFDGDQEALIRTVIGSVEVSDSRQVARLQPMLEDALERSGGGTLVGAGLDQWASPKASATLTLSRHSTWGEETVTYAYDGHTAAFIQDKPRVGTKPSFGGALLDLAGKLHFGTLLGTTTKVLWSVLGLLTMLIAATGLAIYVARSTSALETRGVRFVAGMTGALAGGLPLAATVSVHVWAAACAANHPRPMPWMTATFVAVLVGAGVLTTRVGLRRALRITLAAAGAAALALPLVAPVATGAGPLTALQSPDVSSTAWVDAVLWLVGLCLLWGARSIGHAGSSGPETLGQTEPLVA